MELLENIEPDAEVIEACQKLKKSGYLLALDDFEFRAEYEPLLALADIVKIDFLAINGEERRNVTKLLAPFKVDLVAEKVETREDFEEGLELGFKYFQGYFFFKPEIVSRQEIPRFKLHYLRFLREVNRPEVDFDQLEKICKQEASLSVKLLRFLNSAAFSWRNGVTSIREALVRLGERPMRKGASVVAISGIGQDKPSELVVTGSFRARICEVLGKRVGLKDRELDLFFLGMLSVIDALINRPIEEILDELSVSRDTKEALLGGDNALRRILELVLSFEVGDWTSTARLRKELKISEKYLAEAHQKAIIWANDIFNIQG